jgi:hypothetical protein
MAFHEPERADLLFYRDIIQEMSDESSIRGLRRMPVSAAAAIAFAIAGLSGCAFVGGDMFSRDLQYSAGGYDLAGALDADAAGLSEVRIDRVVASGGDSAILVFARSGSSSRLALLDDGAKGLAILINGQFGRFLGTDDSGRYVCGTVSVGPGYAMTADQTACTDDALDVGGTSLVLKRGDDVPNSVSYVDLYYKDDPGTLLVRAKIRPGHFYDSADSSIVDGAQTYLYYLARDRSNGSQLLAMRFAFASRAAVSADLETALGGASLYESGIPSVTEIDTGGWAEGAWATADGVVALVNGKESRLVRFEYGTGKELDSIVIDDEWIQGLSFEDGGRYWHYYDRGTGYLRSLRTWWR